MSLFDKVGNGDFFRPFCSRNKEIYFDCICELLQLSGDNISISDADARDRINIYLLNTNLNYEIEEDNQAEPIRKTGNDILRYFRQCGWISEKELSRNGEYETYVEPFCRSLVKYLSRYGEEEDIGGLTNNIYDMYLRLQSAFAADSLLLDRPYTNILKPLIDSMTSLKEKLFELDKSIAGIMKTIMDTGTLNQLGAVILTDTLLEKFFRDYYYIKKEGTIPIVISRINEYIRNMQSDEWVVKISREYSQIKDVTAKEAEDNVRDKIYELKMYLSYDYQDSLNKIEDQINSYQELLHARITLLTGSGVSIESVIDRFLRETKNLTEAERESAFTRIGNCSEVTAQKYVGVRSITYKRKKKELAETEGMEVFDDSEEDRNVLDLIKRNRYSPKKVASFLDTQFKGRDHIEIKDEMVPDRNTAQMYAAAMAMSQINSFPYDAEIKDEMIDYGFVEISNVVFTRKQDANG